MMVSTNSLTSSRRRPVAAERKWYASFYSSLCIEKCLVARIANRRHKTTLYRWMRVRGCQEVHTDIGNLRKSLDLCGLCNYGM